MVRVKGFSADIADPLINSGDLHQPDLGQRHKAHVVGPEVDASRQAEPLDALVVGRPVIAHEFETEAVQAHSVDVHPEKKIESRRSAHGVGFGRMVGWLPRKNRTGNILEVALKPFNDPEAALREFRAYRMLGALGVETFQPVGIFPAQKGDHYVGITRKRSDLMSLDRDEWLVGRLVNNEEEAEIAARNAQTVMDIAQGFAFMHALGIFHPDGQIKNWAVTPEGKIGVIDTENMHVLGTDKEEIFNDAFEYAWNDLEKLVKSLVLDSKDGDTKIYGVGMFAHMDLVHVRAGLEQLLITPYLETLTLMSEQIDDEAGKKLIYTIFEGVMSRFYDNEDWPKHFVDAQHVSYDSISGEKKPLLTV